jgi:hypothetical protein
MPATFTALPDTDELAQAVLAAKATAHGDSNDSEIEAWRDACELALHRLGVTVRDLTDDEISDAENS